MFAHFPPHEIIINAKNVTHVEMITASDRYPDDEHVIVRFVGGGFVEFPPEVSLYTVMQTLEESIDD